MQNNWDNETWDDFLFLLETSSDTTGPECVSQPKSSLSLNVKGEIAEFVFTKGGKILLRSGALKNVIRQTSRAQRVRSTARTVFWDIDDTLGHTTGGIFQFRHGASEVLESLAKSRIKIGFFSDSPLGRMAQVLSDLKVSIGRIIPKSILSFVSNRVYSSANMVVENGGRWKAFVKPQAEMNNIVLIDDTIDILKPQQALSHVKMRFDPGRASMALNDAKAQFEKLQGAIASTADAEKQSKYLGLMRKIYLDQNRLVLYRGVIEKAEQVAKAGGTPFNKAAHDIGEKILLDANPAYTDEIMNLGLSMLKKVNSSFSLAIPRP